MASSFFKQYFPLGILSMATLGINFGSHDSSAALVAEGVVKGAIEEERLNKEKHTKAFPAQSIERLLDEHPQYRNGLNVAYFMQPYKGLVAAIRMGWAHQTQCIQAFKSGYEKFHKRQKDWYFIKTLCKQYGWKAYSVDHHLCHASAAYHMSGFPNATVLTVDGRGEYISVGIYIAGKDRIKRIGAISVPFSLGYFYSDITRFLGFKPQHDEYKIMGLSSYGVPSYQKKFKEIIGINLNGKPYIDNRYFDFWKLGSNQFSTAFTSYFGEPYENIELDKRAQNIAASVQNHLEAIICNLVANSIRKTKIGSLCLAGGVALNCAANKKISELECVNRIFIPPAANDPSAAIGAAIEVEKRISKNQQIHLRWNHAMGPEYSNDFIENALRADLRKSIFEKVLSPPQTAAKLLSQGQVVGWFNGKMEWGPRALGCRSILSPAIDLKYKDILNKQIKFREEFRPFAPIIQSEYLSEYFIYDERAMLLHKFMLSLAKATVLAKDKIPAAIHVDGTARVQLVDKFMTPMVWQILEYYASFTGVRALINTSFNVRGRPIVCTPQDALNAFYDSDLRHMIIGDYHVKK